MTLLLNPVPWLLAALCAWCLVRRRASVGERLAEFGAGLGRTPVIAVLAMLVVAHAGGRLAAAWVSPGDFVQEIVAAQAFVESGTLYPADLSARAETWSAAHRSVVERLVPEWVVARVGARTTVDARWYAVQAHPPALLLAFVWPVTRLGPAATLAALCVLSLFAAAWSARAIVRALVPRTAPRTALALMLVACSWQPVLASIRDGQPSVVIAALVVASWLWAERGRSTAAGLALGVATSLKLYPAVLLVYFAWRSPRTAAAALGTLLASGAVVAGVAGAGAFSSYAASAREVVRMFGASPGNFGLMPIARAAAASDAAGTLAGLAAGTAMAGAAWVLIGRRRAARGSVLDRAEELSLAACTALLVSPVSWHHYGVLALLPLVVLLVRAADTGHVGVLCGWAVLAAAWSFPDYVRTGLWWRLPAEPSLVRALVSPTLVLPCAWLLLAASILHGPRTGARTLQPAAPVS